MAILEGIQIRNFRALKDISLGQTIYESDKPALPRLLAVIGANGVGKSSLLDALGFVGDCLTQGVEAACDKPHRGGFERLRTQGETGPIEFEIRYRESESASDRPINYILHISCDERGRAFVQKERLRQRRKGQKHGQPFPFVDATNGSGYAWSGESTEKEEGNQYIPVRMSDSQVLSITTLGTLTDHPRIGRFRNFPNRRACKN